METNEHWAFQPTQDKLNIFVSSRLQECKDERVVARDSIVSINHNPVLFEHLGARSYKARSLYLSRLRDSTIMVAIHRLGYGYVDTANGMTISGLEDELNFALENNISVLLYVYADDTGRDPALTELIKRASATLTIRPYSDADDLECIRDDASAEITRLVLLGQTQQAFEESSKNLLARTVARQGYLIDRGGLLAELQTQSLANPILCVHGGPGTGKTTLVAQLAEKTDSVFLRATGLAPLEVFSLCSQLVATGDSDDTTHTTLSGARLALASAWAESEDVCLVLDECDFVEDILVAVEAGGGTSEKKRIVFTSHSASENAENFEVPTVGVDDAREALKRAGLELPADASGPFTPLQIQTIIGDAELAASEPSQRTREILTYLALSPAPLTADQLLNLLGDDKITPEDLFADVKSVGRMIDDSPAGYRLMHAQTGAKLTAELQESAQRFQFFANRLVRLFQQRSEFRMAYRVAEQIGTDAADRLSKPALRQATLLGDHKLSLAVANRMLAKAEQEGSKSDAFDLMISLVYPLELIGNVARAQELIRRAEELAPALGEQALNGLEEVKLASRARRTLADSDVQGLEAVYQRYRELGEDWDAGRVAIELSALYISSKQFEKAIDILRAALEVFEEVGDEYGTDVAERNLAASLAGLPGNDAEVDKLVKRIEERSDSTPDKRRQRAWHLNILNRRYRTSGRLADAEKAALEILEICAELGDEALAAITKINLGNVYSDMRDAKRAMAAYDEAATIAQRCGRRDVEADASRLRAVVLNDLEESAEIVENRRDQARVFAQHAIGLLEGSIYHEALARSFVELADAHKHLGNELECARANFSAAIEFRKIPDEEGFEAGLVRGAERALDNDADEFYLNELARVFGVELKADATLGEHFIALLEPIIAQAGKESFLRILGRHLERIRSKFPPLLRPILLKALLSAIEHFSRGPVDPDQAWRPLYAGLIAPFLAQNAGDELLLRRLALSLTREVDGLSVRYTQNGDVVWTVSLGENDERVVSVTPLDDTPRSLVAAQSLALFLKAFETEFLALVGDSKLEEIAVNVASFEEFPDDMKEMARGIGNVDQLLEDQAVLVTRTEDFSGGTPAIVLLHPEFLARASTGIGVSGSLQVLFALTLTEMLFVMLEGEVDEELLRPKVISLVGQTLS